MQDDRCNHCWPFLRQTWHVAYGYWHATSIVVSVTALDNMKGAALVDILGHPTMSSLTHILALAKRTTALLTTLHENEVVVHDLDVSLILVDNWPQVMLMFLCVIHIAQPKLCVVTLLRTCITYKRTYCKQCHSFHRIGWLCHSKDCPSHRWDRKIKLKIWSGWAKCYHAYWELTLM